VVHPPHTLRADPVVSRNKQVVINVTWKKPFGEILDYRLYRVDGSTVSPAAFARRTQLTQTTLTSFTDDKVNPGATYTYFAIARAVGGRESSMSNEATVTIPK
jgi:fibronectin type 3 domain-containing protein